MGGAHSDRVGFLLWFLLFPLRSVRSAFVTIRGGDIWRNYAKVHLESEENRLRSKEKLSGMFKSKHVKRLDFSLLCDEID